MAATAAVVSSTHDGAVVTTRPRTVPARLQETESLLALVPDTSVEPCAPVRRVKERTSLDGTSGAPIRRLPGAVAYAWDWQLQGSCRTADPDLFFHPWGERDPMRGRRERGAKAVCASCPVLEACRSYALTTKEPYGVWGGLSEHDRELILGVRFG